MTSVLLTGGAGNLGRLTAQKLAQKGYSVRVFDLPDLDFSFSADYPDIEVHPGDIRNPSDLKRACEGIEWVVHLAAVIPPMSEANNALAQDVNVKGTQNLLEALDSRTPVLFASSVAAYGVPQTEIVRIDHPLEPVDFYGETKRINERDILESGRPFAFLRISGISVPALLEIPRPWFFKADQRLEFVHLADAAEAFVNCIENDASLNRILHISGGPTWQMFGTDYAGAICNAFDTPTELSTYLEQPSWTGWYDTKDSQALLHYQNHTFERYTEQLRALYREAIA